MNNLDSLPVSGDKNESADTYEILKSLFPKKADPAKPGKSIKPIIFASILAALILTFIIFMGYRKGKINLKKSVIALLVSYLILIVLVVAVKFLRK